MGVSRRRFLGMTGAAAGLALLPAEFSELLDAIMKSHREWPGPALETWMTSVCQLCPGGCGIRVRLLDGWPVKIRGNPDHSINQGGLCPRGEAGLQALYDPDRIRRPRRRLGDRGEGKWKEISWDEAIRFVAEKLQAIRTRGRPEGLVVIGGQYRGLMQDIWERFLGAYGSPNYVSTSFGCDSSDAMLDLMQGLRGSIGYDLANAGYVLSFGMSLLEGSWSPVWQMRGVAELRQGRPGHRVKIVQVDIRFSMSAAKADEWAAIVPGTDGALALAIAHVLLRDGLYDRAFVREHGFGMEDWTDASGARREGFRTVILRDFSPKAVAPITGVPEGTIERIAHEFGSERPAVALVDHGSARYSNGLFTRWAVHCLNALAGSLEVPGGITLPPPISFAPLPPLPSDSVAERGRSRPRLDGAMSAEAPLVQSAVHRLPDALRSGEPYSAEAVFLYYANPAFSLPGRLGMQAALENVPLVVSFSPFVDEGTEAADIVLPDHTYLERWQDDPTPRNVPFPVLGIRRPVREPLYDTRATSDVVFALAKALGDPIRAAFPWKNTEAFLKERVRGVYESGKGMLGKALPLDWQVPPPEGREKLPGTFDEFWTKLLENGSWCDPDYSFRDFRRVLRTPSGRFEFTSERLAAAFAAGPVARATTQTHSPGTPQASPSVPMFEPPEAAGDETRYPLVLNVFRPLALMGGRTANMPFLLEIVGKTVSNSEGTWIEINPRTAEPLGIKEGDTVRVESPFGELRVRARLHPGTHPKVVNIPFGLGHRNGGRWAKDFGVNPNGVVGSTAMAVTGGPAYTVTRVRVIKA
jgi:anaerobic selenocysteine-containing dehydrogenase